LPFLTCFFQKNDVNICPPVEVNDLLLRNSFEVDIFLLIRMIAKSLHVIDAINLH
jgi:hypothetical protein